MIVSWMTTNKCNLHCKHCYQNAGESRAEELTTAEARELIDGIARAGFRIMIFSGGEALLRPDILELVSYASSKGLRPVFGTNGTLLTPEIVRALKASGAAAMGISLDSLDRDKHNAFRGDETAFDRTLQGMENCREAGLPLQLHTTVMDWNRDEKRIMMKQKEIPIPIKPTCAPQFTRVAKQLGVTLDRRFTRGCLAGLTYCIVSPVGMVRPCAYMTEEAGSIREKPFDEIWKNSELFASLRTRNYGGYCSACGYQDICGGCRARAAYYHNGDYMAADSYCAYGLQMQEA